MSAATVVRADPEKLQQALERVLRPAFPQSEPARAVALQVLPGPGSRHIEIHDNGPGMSPQELQTLFKPFNQKDPAPAGAAKMTPIAAGSGWSWRNLCCAPWAAAWRFAAGPRRVRSSMRLCHGREGGPF